MKAILCLIALVFITTVRADQPTQPRVPLDGFLGIPWGATDDDAKAQLSTRANARFNPKESTEKRLRFEGGQFAEFHVNHFTLNFVNGGFCTAQVQLAPTTKNHRKEFLTFKQMLTEKFGPPERDEQDADILESTWYFRLPKQPANLINLVADQSRPDLTILYNSDNTRKTRRDQPAPPQKVPAGAKDDL